MYSMLSTFPTHLRPTLVPNDDNVPFSDWWYVSMHMLRGRSTPQTSTGSQRREGVLHDGGGDGAEGRNQTEEGRHRHLQQGTPSSVAQRSAAIYVYVFIDL